MKNFMKLVLATAVVAMTFSSCNCFKKMSGKQDQVTWAVTPEVLTLNNGIVAADLHVTFPAKYFQPDAMVKVTPVMVVEGGEIAGKPQYFQGSKVEENYTVIDKKNGGNQTIHFELPYDERMDNGTLQVRAEIKCKKGKCNEFTPVNLNDGSMPTKAERKILAEGSEAEKTVIYQKFGLNIAQGVNTLQKDIKYSDMMETMPHQFKKVTTVVYDTDLRYEIGSSRVIKKHQKAANLDAFKEDVDSKLNNDRITNTILVKGYASPDGPEKFNDELSADRSESSKKVVAKLLKDAGLDVDAASYGEDWDGFKELVERSNIQDKELILQVLSLYNSATQREQEIKNMASVYTELKDEILPELRRSKIINSSDIQGKTDAEILAAIKNGEELSKEEYLYAAEELVEDKAERVAVLETAAKKYNEADAWNNLGVAYAANGQNEDAAKAFDKAAKLDSNAEINNNLLLVNLANGKTEEAKKYAMSADAESKAALAAAEGDYAAAAKNMSGYNEAIVLVMNNNLSGAKKAIANDKSAEADYLRAVIAAKEGDTKTAQVELSSAISKNPELAKKAAKDVNLKAIQK